MHLLKKVLVCVFTASLLCTTAACGSQEGSQNEQSGEETGEAKSFVTGLEAITADDLIPPEEETATETSETRKVLKFSVENTGKYMSRYISFSDVPVVDIGEGYTLEYDVYLETAFSGFGALDLAISGMQDMGFVNDGVLKDSTGISIYASLCDLSNAADERWYHRVIDIASGYATGVLKRISFTTAADIPANETAVCYYDNICIKDAGGNIVYTFDLESVAAKEIRQTGSLVCTFSMADDPAPQTERKAASEEVNTAAAESTLTGHESLNLAFRRVKASSMPGIYIGNEDDTCFGGLRGYFICISSDSLTLYRSDETLSVMASVPVTGVNTEDIFKIRVELDGTVLRGYYLDDMDGVEPWPEFELEIEDVTGCSYGYADLSGGGAYRSGVVRLDYEAPVYEKTYTNILFDDFADPDVLYYDGVYYMYGTMGPGYKVFSSTDLITWEDRGVCMTNDAWGFNEWFWAPGVKYINGKFYLLCSVMERLGFAVSDSPLGPFVPAENYMFDEFTIDGNIFVDDDGSVYIYYVSKREGHDYGIYGVKMNMETLQPELSTETLLFSVSETWETYNSADIPGKSTVCEAPYMLKHNGVYYLLYSGSDYLSHNYAVGYATSDSPLGSFEKYEGSPILLGNSEIAGTGHCAVTTSPDGSEMFIVYHSHHSMTQVELRKISVDRLRFAPTASGVDRIEVYGPTVTPQPYPAS